MRFDVSFRTSDQRFAVQMQADDRRFDAAFASVQPATAIRELEPYAGEYTVTPKVTAQVLPTAQKRMQEDVTIREIPYYATSNPQRGETVYIGLEVEIYGN